MILAMNEHFANYNQAIEAGFTAAQNWVDDTELRHCSKTTKLCAYSRRLREKSRIMQQISRSTVAKSRTIVEQSLALYLTMRPPALPVGISAEG